MIEFNHAIYTVCFSVRAKKVFDLDDTFTLKRFRLSVTQCPLARPVKPVQESMNENRDVLASVLFQPDSNIVVSKSLDDPPAKVGHNYWTTSAPDRTRLSPNYSMYMETIKLAEYQRYLGPESARKNKDWTVYFKTVIHHAVGGEEQFLKMVLEQRKLGRSLHVIDDLLKEAVIGKKNLAKKTI